jgi:hypothetical protein
MSARPPCIALALATALATIVSTLTFTQRFHPAPLIDYV